MTVVDVPADMVTAADFDLDGLYEYVIGTRHSCQLFVISDSLSHNKRQATIPLASQPVALTNVDFNGDGIPELAVAVDAHVDLLVCDRRLNFSLAKSFPLPAPARDLEVQSFRSGTALVVATAECVHMIDLTEAQGETLSLGRSASDAAAHLHSLRELAMRHRLSGPSVTAREREVLTLALRGMTARQIGAKLFIADRTVETHLAHAYSKLGVRSRFELIARISEHGAAGFG